MTLPTRPLGRSGLRLTTVGFGAWAAGGGGWAFGWGPQDDAESLAAMRRALELGVNWIDTAAIYGLGHSEVLVGRLLREWTGDRPLVFTKGGLVWDAMAPMVPAVQNLRPASIRSECEASLRRLGLNGVVRRTMDGHLFLTDNGTLIVDVTLDDTSIASLHFEELAEQIDRIPGVLDHGLFLTEADEVLVETNDGRIERLLRPAGAVEGEGNELRRA